MKTKIFDTTSVSRLALAAVMMTLPVAAFAQTQLADTGQNIADRLTQTGENIATTVGGAVDPLAPTDIQVVTDTAPAAASSVDVIVATSPDAAVTPAAAGTVTISLEETAILEAAPSSDRIGLIQEQSRITEDILLMNRETQRIASIKALLDTVGLEGLALIYPDLAKRLEGSPLVIQSRIEQVKLLKELGEEVRGAAPEPVEVSVETEIDIEAQKKPGGFIDMPVGQVGADAFGSVDVEEDAELVTEAELDEIKAQAVIDAKAEIEASAAAEATRNPDFSLREIYGIGSSLTAVIAVNEERFTVRSGDLVSGGYTINAIGQDFVTMTRDGEVKTVQIRG